MAIVCEPGNQASIIVKFALVSNLYMPENTLSKRKNRISNELPDGKAADIKMIKSQKMKLILNGG
jgi:hypothetical protein